MTTIIYKNGAIYSDTCLTDVTTNTQFIQDKIHRFEDHVFAAAGYLGLAQIFLNKKLRKMMEVLPVLFVLDFFKVTEKGNSARIIIADKEEVRVYGIVNVFTFGIVNVVRRKKVFEAKLDKNLVFSIGSGSSHEIDMIALQYSPEVAIKHASSFDYYTNDVITSVDVREMFGM